jgi:hypothetical protein
VSQAVYKAITRELEKAAAAMEAARRLVKLIEDEDTRRSLGCEISYADQHLPIRQDDRPGRYRWQVQRILTYGRHKGWMLYRSRLRYARRDFLGVLKAHRASVTRNPGARCVIDKIRELYPNGNHTGVTILRCRIHGADCLNQLEGL